MIIETVSNIQNRYICKNQYCDNTSSYTHRRQHTVSISYCIYQVTNSARVHSRVKVTDNVISYITYNTCRTAGGLCTVEYTMGDIYIIYTYIISTMYVICVVYKD